MAEVENNRYFPTRNELVEKTPPARLDRLVTANADVGRCRRSVSRDGTLQRPELVQKTQVRRMHGRLHGTVEEEPAGPGESESTSTRLRGFDRSALVKRVSHFQCCLCILLHIY